MDFLSGNSDRLIDDQAKTGLWFGAHIRLRAAVRWSFQRGARRVLVISGLNFPL